MATSKTLRPSLWKLPCVPKRSSTSVAAQNVAPLAQQPPLTYRSQWKQTTDVPLTRQSLIDLFHGKTPLIKEAGFLSPELCWKHEKVLAPQLAPYKHNTGPQLRKVGVAQFEYQAQSEKDFGNRADEKQEYFEEADKWRSLHEELAAKTGVNTYKKVVDRIAALVPDWDIELASEGPDRTYFSGIYRALNDATHVHCDWSPYDSLTEDWVINQVEAQVVFNLYLAPVKGGSTVVHDLQWTEDALRMRDPDSYGYRRELVADRQKAVVHPEPGALCFFNSRNMHEVQSVIREPMPALGLSYRPRLTLSSFMGLIPSHKTKGKPKLILWS